MLWTVLAAACGPGVEAAGPGCAEDAAPPPSFVVVVADTLRADFVAPGARETLAPNLARLAEEAVEFEAAFSQAPWTKPSVASLLTGLHPQAHGVLDHDGIFGHGDGPGLAGVLPGDLETIPERLSGAGYQTAAFVANEWLDAGYGFEQGFDHYTFVRRGRIGNVFEQGLEWLSRRDPSRPFLLYLHLMEVHGPYNAPERFVEQARAALAHEPARPLSPAERAAIPDHLDASPWSTDPRTGDLREWRVRYGAGVAAFDAALGFFSDTAKAAGWLDEAVLVVTSDHGEELLDHGGWNHGATFYDEMLRVPLLVRLPGGRHGGRRIPDVVSLIDLHPTLLALAGVEAPSPPPHALRGADLTPVLCGGEPEGAERSSVASASKRDPGIHSLRTPEARLILDDADGSLALFDLASDPGEQRDLADAEPERARRLESQLRAHLRALDGQRRSAEAARVSPEMRARLEALGYVGD